MEDGAAVGGDDVRTHAELLHKVVHPLPKEEAVLAVEGDKLQGRHILDLAPQLFLQLLRIIIPPCAVDFE